MVSDRTTDKNYVFDMLPDRFTFGVSRVVPLEELCRDGEEKTLTLLALRETRTTMHVSPGRI